MNKAGSLFLNLHVPLEGYELLSVLASTFFLLIRLFTCVKFAFFFNNKAPAVLNVQNL